MPDALVVSDRDGIIRVWNHGAERIFGFSEQEALGQSLDIITPERLRKRHWQGYETTMKTGKTKYGAGELLAVPAIRKDGAQISVQFSIMPIHDSAVLYRLSQQSCATSPPILRNANAFAAPRDSHA